MSRYARIILFCCLLVYSLAACVASEPGLSADDPAVAEDTTAAAIAEMAPSAAPTGEPLIAPTTAVQTDSPPKEVYAVGDRAGLEPFRISVTDVRTAAEVDGTPALEGNQFILVDVELENTGAEPQDVAMLIQMILEDDIGQVHAFNLDASANSVMQLNGTIDAGEQVSGTVGFMLPTDAEDLRFVFRTIQPGAMEEAGRVAFTIEL